VLNPNTVYFSVHEPRSEPTPLVVEVPHAGLLVDAEAERTLAAPEHAMRRDADLYVDELYADAPDVGAALLVAHVSRYVCDLNRAEDDVDALAVEGGTARSSPHGLIWRRTTDNRPALRRPIEQSELNRRLTSIYRPYHRALEELVLWRMKRFGYAILLCAHSMPSRGREGHIDPGRERADVVPGTRGKTTAGKAVLELTEHTAAEYGFSVVHDEPYRGGFTTGRYGRPAEGVHAIQVELARRLYMDESVLTKNPSNFEQLRKFCRSLTGGLSGLRVP